MTPFQLLLVFLGLAACAFAAFAYLTLTASTPLRDDWKKFLSSFAGTALALSVGFVSLMLQQENQGEQKTTDETAQIRSRLLYSAAQKKLELLIFTNDLSGPDTFKNVCERTEGRVERLNAVISSGDISGLQFMREAFDKLFSSDAYERNALSRLMKETNFSSRIDQQMLSELLSSEIKSVVVGPKLVSMILNIPPATQIDAFCNRVEFAKTLWRDFIQEMTKLQLSTCVTYAVIGQDRGESHNRSAAAFKHINEFLPASEDQRSNRRKQLIADLVGDVGVSKADFEGCLKFVGFSSGHMPGF